MAKAITGNTIKLRNVRLSYPQLHEAAAPKNVKDANPKKSFSANFLLDPKNASHVPILKEIQAEVARLRKEAWGGPHLKEKFLAGSIGQDGFGTPECFGKGSLKTNNDGVILNGYEGMYFVAGKSNEDKRPLILARDKTIISDSKDINRIMYGGCFVNANINFWVQDNDFGKAIRCGLQAVQFWNDGDAFGGGRASVDDFDDVEEPEGIDGLDGFDDDIGLD
jgi:hypothetical protein